MKSSISSAKHWCAVGLNAGKEGKFNNILNSQVGNLWTCNSTIAGWGLRGGRHCYTPWWAASRACEDATSLLPRPRLATVNGRDSLALYCCHCHPVLALACTCTLRLPRLCPLDILSFILIKSFINGFLRANFTVDLKVT